MTETKILVVEDDAIIGRHIQNSLKKLGYIVLDALLSGEEAVERARQLVPDLVLMDIHLAGEMDGVEAAGIIRSGIHVPVIFLTAFADPQTLQRAKVTEPFGYLLKPFDERILQITIEMALYKHQLERRLVESEEMLRTLVENQGEGVAIIARGGEFIFSNPALESIFGVERNELAGKNIFSFLNESNSERFRNGMDQCCCGERGVYETEIVRPTRERRQVLINAAPWINKQGEASGCLALIRDITEHKQIEAAEQRARGLAEALRDTAAALNGTLDIEQVYDLILTHVGRVVPTHNASIMLIEGDYARFVRSQLPYRLEDQVEPNDLIEWRRFEVFRKMGETKKPVVVPNYNFMISTRGRVMEWLRSYVGAPLQANGEIIGFINLGSTQPGFFTAEHGAQLEAFAHQASLAVENARLFQETDRRARFLSMLNDITSLAINIIDEGKTIDAVVEKMRSLFQADGAFITSWDETLQLTIPAASYGHASENYTFLPHKPGELTLTASSLQIGHALAVEDIHHTPYIDSKLARTFPFKSMMGLPLIADGIRLGAVLIGYVDRHVFSREEIENGEQVSHQVALAVSKARLFSQVQRTAITDELTGLFNRRGIFEKGRAALEAARQFSKPLALIWMDIDHFKQVNDTYGHHIGDQVVQGVADCCRAGVRDCDSVGRYGGEGGDELIVLLPDMDKVRALQIAERLRARIAGQIFDTDQGPMTVTVSLGISILSQDINDLMVLLDRADQAMYAAKSSGRNCVVVAEET